MNQQQFEKSRVMWHKVFSMIKMISSCLNILEISELEWFQGYHISFLWKELDQFIQICNLHEPDLNCNFNVYMRKLKHLECRVRIFQKCIENRTIPIIEPYIGVAMFVDTYLDEIKNTCPFLH